MGSPGNGLEYVGLVVLGALTQYFLFAFHVAALREKKGIAPTEAAPDDRELTIAIRVHANTGEMLIVFLPLIAIAGLATSGSLAAGIGAFWIVARFIYRRGYFKDVKGRIPGFLMGDAVFGLLLLVALYGLGNSLLHRWSAI